MQYSDKFRSRMVSRMLGPPVVSATGLSKEVGVSHATLSRWVRDAGTVAGVNAEKITATPVRDPKRGWSPQDKLRAVVDSLALAPDEVGVFLRTSGLHQVELDEWREAVVAALEEQGSGAQRRSAKKRDKRVRELEKELRRKDRALAETAALLVLEKKVQALWGAEDDDTGEGNEK